MLAANLALKGFVALSFDPVGQGEREQTYDPQLKAPAAGWSVPEHVQSEAQARLIGEGVARYFIWDSAAAAGMAVEELFAAVDVERRPRFAVQRTESGDFFPAGVACWLPTVCDEVIE